MNPDFLAQPPCRYRAASLKQVCLGHWQTVLSTPRRAAQAIRLLTTHHRAVTTSVPRSTT